MKGGIRMKNKILLWIVTTALCYLSCEKEESDLTLSNDYIRFSVAKLTVEPGTRSTFHNTFPTNGTFGVMGYCVPFMREYDKWDWASGIIGWGNKKVNAHPDVFYKQEVTYNGNSCNYSYSGDYSAENLRKWYSAEELPDDIDVNTDNFRYSFFAYYPVDAFSVSPTDKNAKGAPILTFAMPFKAGVHDEILDDSKTPDAMLAVEYNHLRTSGNVEFNFNHMLVGLGFQVNNYNENTEITINSVSLSGIFHRTMTVDFNKETNEPDFYSCKETYQGTYEIFNGTENVDPGSSSLIGNKHLLLLSDAAGRTYFGSNVTLKIDYTYEGKEQSYSTGRPGEFMPRAGTKYTAQLNFIGDSFVLNFVVDNGEFWENGGDSDLTIQ